MTAPWPGLIGTLSGISVFLDYQRAGRELAEVPHLNGLRRREGAPVQEVAAGLGVEDAERNRLGPIGSSWAELNHCSVGDDLDVASAVGSRRAKGDGLPLVT